MSARVKDAEELVAELESLNETEWHRLRQHEKYVQFMEEYQRSLCIARFWCFKRWVYWKNRKHYYEPLHGRQGLDGWLHDWSRTRHGIDERVNVKFLIWCRETCKTQTAIAWDAWQVGRDPNKRGLIRAYTDPAASQIITSVEQLLMSDVVQWLFPWVRPATRGTGGQPLEWNEKSFLLEREDIGVRVPTMQACGLKTDPTGTHFHIGHYDDYEVRENANSDSLRETMIKIWQNDDNLFMAGAQRLFCGTPWSRRALIWQVLRRQGDLAEHDYDVSVQPWYVEVFKHPYEGHEPQLMADRVTIVDSSASFPVYEADLKLCQAKLRFFNEAMGDVQEELREVVWNNHNSFRLSRPIPALLGQPLHYTIGTRKPVAPNRFTLDDVDLGDETEETIVRASIPRKRRTQGSLVFSAQMEMDAIDETNMVLNPNDVQIIEPDELPEGPRRYFRSVDLASKKKSKASTCFTTGFTHSNGLFIQHICYQNLMNSMEKLLELFLGVQRVWNWGYELEWTSLEKALIEETLSDFFRDAQRNPYEFFRFGDRANKRPKFGNMTYGQYADKYFADDEGKGFPIRLKVKWLTRGGYNTKNDRISAQQPDWESGKIHIVRTCPHIEDFLEQARTFTMESEDPNDMLDTTADLVRETAPPRVKEERLKKPRALFFEIQREALLRNSLAGVSSTAWPPRG